MLHERESQAFAWLGELNGERAKKQVPTSFLLGLEHDRNLNTSDFLSQNLVFGFCFGTFQVPVPAADERLGDCALSADPGAGDGV